MRIIIVGAGLVGTQLAKGLIREKHDVSLIEADEERARHASNRIDCRVIHAQGNNFNALEEAGIARADALVCVTGSDEVNMIICGLAASRYGKGAKGLLSKGLVKIARVRNDDYIYLSRNEDEKILGIDHFIHPSLEAARSIMRAMEYGALGNIVSFPNTNYELGSVDVAAGSAFDGLELKVYHRMADGESLITLVERKGAALLPSGATVLAGGDRIYILADKNNLPFLFSLAGSAEKPIRKIGIVGGGRVGSLLAESLLDGASNIISRVQIFSLLQKLFTGNTRRITVVEQDYRLCKELAERFPNALILNNDISDESFITEEQLDTLDLLVTTTSDQELNIITAVYLKSRGVGRTIAMVTGSGYAAMARHLGVDVVVPIQSVVVDSILSHLMGSSVKQVHNLGDGSVEIIQVEIGENASIADKPINQFRLSGGSLLMLATRNGSSFIPRGDYVFCRGDRIFLICKTGSQAEIEKYFGADK
jgi:trk system potassium uptake protein TrkA